MKKSFRQLINMLCAFILVISLTAPIYVNAEENSERVVEEQAEAKPQVSENDIADMNTDLVAVVNNSLTKETCVLGNEWAVMTVARAGALSDEMKENYYNSVASEVKAGTVVSSAYFADNNPSAYAKVIIALTAIGKNPENVNGVNFIELLSKTNLIGSGDLNAVMYALIAFDCGNYEIWSSSDGARPLTRDALVAEIISHEISGGGWDWSDSAPDTDMTAIGIQALTPYYDKNPEAKAAVDRALVVLSDIQNDDGSFSSYGWANACSTAQVITALTGMKINPLTDGRFIKNGRTVFDGINIFYIKGQGISGYGNEIDIPFSTVQSAYALVSYDRFTKGKAGLYNMSDNVTKSEKPHLARLMAAVVIMLLVIVLCGVFLIIKLRKSKM